MTLRSGRIAKVGFKDRASTISPGPSQVAAESTIKAAITRRALVLDCLEKGGPQTAEQIYEATGLHWYLVRPRCSELAADGLVCDTGERGEGAMGGRATRWGATSELERCRWRQEKAEAERRARRDV